MSLLDWGIFFAFLAWVVIDGVRKRRVDGDASEQFLAGRSAPWWVMGLSIMATQASAITMLSTTGKGYEDGLRFAQFYLGVPVAMVILAFTLLPLYRRAQVFTAYEYLGQRFDERTRLLSAVIFLILRALSLGIVIQAPSAILSAILGLESVVTIVVMGGIAIAYTTIGGMRAVLSTDVKQMAVMILGLGIAFVVAIRALPTEVGFGGALHLAEVTDRLDFLDWRFDPSEQFTVWSALLGGTLLFLAYFGCDQSQAQRYLSGRSLRDERGALALNAVAKFPFQLFILFTGVLVFAVHTFDEPPVSFVPTHADAVRAGAIGEVTLGEEGQTRTVDGDRVVAEARGAWSEARRAALATIADRSDRAAQETYRLAAEHARTTHGAAVEVLARATGDTSGEQRYIFAHFIRDALPIGLIGLLIAAIFAAALSSIDSELNALATVAVMDLHPAGRARRLTPAASRRAASNAMLGFGALATGFALASSSTTSLVVAVNQIGSLFYGALLGTFILAVAVPRVGGIGASAALVAGVAAVVLAELATGGKLAFLYRNTAGTSAAVLTGILVSGATGEWRRRGSENPPETDLPESDSA